MNSRIDSLLIRVSTDEQRLQLTDAGEVVLDCRIATARNGVGERKGSECTPRGWHRVRARIGAGCPENTVFVGRRPTGELYSPALKAQHPKRDWILTRILWLSGLEPGRNRFGVVDTMRRYVYIHGCPDEDEMGVPSSHGCIKMRNAEVIELFERVPAGTRVLIQEAPLSTGVGDAGGPR
ncbi:MAG: L,D-transpeptidase [Gammaproteobacteria bacterium]